MTPSPSFGNCNCPSRSCLIFVDNADLTWIETFKSAAQFAEEAGYRVEVWDASEKDVLGLKSSWIAARKGIVPITATKPSARDKSFRLRKNKIEVAPETFLEIEESVRAALQGFLRDDRPNPNRGFYQKLFKLLTASACKVWGELIDHLRVVHYCAVLIPNGRFPTQVAAAESAAGTHASVFYFEQALSKNQIFLADHMIHDFTALDRKNSEIAISKEHLGEAERWLQARVLGGGGNQFSSRFEEQKVAELIDIRMKTFTLFTSSQDEFWSLGSLWPKVEWPTQFSALRHCAREIQRVHPGSKIILRMHPNTASKSLAYIQREIREVRQFKREFPGALIVPPLSRVSTYELLENSSAAFVWASTVGVEALYKNIPVVHLAPSFFIDASSRTLLQPGGDLWRIIAQQSDHDLREIAIRSVGFWFSICGRVRDLRSIDVPWTRLEALRSLRNFASFSLHLRRVLSLALGSIYLRVALGR